MSLSDNMAECNLCITTCSKPFKWFFLGEETLLSHLSCTIQYISKNCDSSVENTRDNTMNDGLRSQSKCVYLGGPFSTLGELILQVKQETYTGFIARFYSLILAQGFSKHCFRREELGAVL